MAGKISFPTPITLLMIVIVLAVICTWLLPAGEYSKLSVSGSSFSLKSEGRELTLPLTQKTLDSLGLNIQVQKFIDGDIRKAISVPGTFAKQERHGQGFMSLLFAPLNGIYESIDIILFILVIGGFMYVFNETGAMVKGITWLSYKMKGRESWLITILTVIFSFLGASYGMAEEALVFYPILVPLFMTAGYDLMVPLAVIHGGAAVGGIGAFSNPFSTIIASNAAGINWMDGLTERLVIWVLATWLLVWFIQRYAAKVKKDPSASLVAKIDGDVKPPYESNIGDSASMEFNWKSKVLLIIYFMAFLVMIGGVVFLKWWTLEMSALFLGVSILMALITGIKEKVFINEFMKGAESLLSVAFIIGVARGVTIVLNDGHVSDSILYYASGVVQVMPPMLFILSLLVFYLFFSLFIQSQSGMAVLTMPIIGALAIVVNIPGKEIVNAYQFGLGIMSFIAPTGLTLPSLAMVNVSLKAWLKFITPFLIAITILCALALIVGLYM